jgi:methionyl aminopeptidase
MTKVKTPEEIVNIRQSGRILAQVLEVIGKSVAEGVTTKQLADIARQELARLGGKPAFLGYNGFPDVLCVSLNDAVVHGVPGDEILKNGDLVSFDFGVNYKGMITDAARTVIVGQASPAETNLVKETQRSLDAGINAVHGGCRVGDIASAVQNVLERSKLGIVRDLVGHGVGHELQEEPNVPN